MHEDGEQQDDRQRYSDQPKLSTFSETHRSLHQVAIVPGSVGSNCPESIFICVLSSAPSVEDDREEIVGLIRFEEERRVLRDVRRDIAGDHHDIDKGKSALGALCKPLRKAIC
jgi:hypothetical protein